MCVCVHVYVCVCVCMRMCVSVRVCVGMGVCVRGANVHLHCVPFGPQIDHFGNTVCCCVCLVAIVC